MGVWGDGFWMPSNPVEPLEPPKARNLNAEILFWTLNAEARLR